MGHEFTFEGGPLTGLSIAGGFPRSFRYPDKLFVQYDGVPIPEGVHPEEYADWLVEKDWPVTVGALGVLAEYEFDRYESGHFRMAST